jgi:hypothetical protein
MNSNPYLAVKEGTILIAESLAPTGDDRSAEAENRYRQQMRDWEIEEDARDERLVQLEESCQV